VILENHHSLMPSLFMNSLSNKILYLWIVVVRLFLDGEFLKNSR
jgi:hypothetical protein